MKKINLVFPIILLVISVAWLLNSFALFTPYLTYGQWFSVYAFIVSIWLIVKEVLN